MPKQTNQEKRIANIIIARLKAERLVINVANPYLTQVATTANQIVTSSTKITSPDLPQATTVVNQIPISTTNIDGAVTITGYKKSTIYSLVHKRKIPFHKPPGSAKLIFDIEELNNWMRSDYKDESGKIVDDLERQFNERHN